LPIALEKAIESYHDFLDNPNGEEANEFKNRHNAYKAALAHIELLIKLADMVETEKDNIGDELHRILMNAKEELEKGCDECTT
jgi:3-dehydroquinate dehydratase